MTQSSSTRLDDSSSPSPSDRPPVPLNGAAAAVDDGTKLYGSGPTAVQALNRVTVRIPRARLTAIMGPSGSGKSTLMHCMAGLDTLTEGRAFLGDLDLAELSDKDLTLLRRDRVGFVFQAFNLIPTLSAEANIVLPLTLAKAQPEREWFDRVVSTVGLADRLQHRPSELSGGQLQRTAVARALITRPDICFADEPTGNLDSRSGAEVLGFLRQAVDELGQTVAMVTHDPAAAAYADSVTFLSDGQVVDEMPDPTAQRVLDRMKAFGG